MDKLIQFDSGFLGLSGQHYLANKKNQINIDLFVSQEKAYIDIDEVISKINDFGISSILEYNTQSLFKEIIREHGIFYQKFIEEHIRKFVRPIILSSNIDQQKIHEKYYPFLNISDYTKANLKLINQIELELLRFFTFTSIDNADLRAPLSDWFFQYNQKRTCKICGESYRLVNIPNWVYIGVFPYKDCCFNCNIVEKNGKNEILDYIDEFVNNCGFIPPSNYDFLNKEFTCRIGNNWEQVIRSYSKVGHPWYVKDIFGNWFNALHEAKIIETISTSRGVKCLSLDKHLCNSLAEKQIDDWLFEHGIEHEKEPLYPKDKLFNASGKRRGDWKVNNVFIEYFGLIGDKQYEQKLFEKKQLTKLLDIELIEIYPLDLKDLDNKLMQLTLCSMNNG